MGRLAALAAFLSFAALASLTLIAAPARAGCIWGCKDRLHQCNDGCRLNAPQLRTCDDLIEATEARVRHHIHHSCQGIKNEKNVIECGYSAMLADEYGRAVRGGLINLCANQRISGAVQQALDYYKHRIYNHPEVKKKIREHVGYWSGGNFWATLQQTFAGGGNPDINVQHIGGSTVATNIITVSNFAQEKRCEPDWPAKYYLAPPEMLDWTPTQSKGGYAFAGFRPPFSATREMYNSPADSRDLTLGPACRIPGLSAAGQNLHDATNVGRSCKRQGAPGSTLGANEGRLASDLRAVARRRDAGFALCEAAKKFQAGDVARGKAFADLSVTGKAAFRSFRALAPNEAKLRSRAECGGVADANLTKALERAYAVANVLRKGDTPERRDFRWIAVSGEDDQPYRPVNMPSSGFPQFELEVDARPISGGRIGNIQTRYMIAHATPPRPSFRRGPPLVDGGSRRVQGDLVPTLDPQANVVLFIHGMDSRLEESTSLTNALHSIASATHRNWTMISLDLPSSGYTDNIDQSLISPLQAVACHVTPLVDFLENFIVAFVDALDRRVPGLKAKIRIIVGGSLGGNMAMRLGRRNHLPGARPESWIRNVAPWSPAAIWPSYIGRPNCASCGCDTGWDGTKDMAVASPLAWAGKDEARFRARREANGALSEEPELRRELFYACFDWAPAGLIGKIFSPNNARPQAELWYRDGWECKAETIISSRIGRHETYDAYFRTWRWRLAAEQLVFSQQQFAPGTQNPLYLYNKTRTFLMCGEKDTGGSLCEETRKVAPKMVNTPGYFKYMLNTGHSLDDERPLWVAREIAEFLRGSP